MAMAFPHLYKGEFPMKNPPFTKDIQGLSIATFDDQSIAGLLRFVLRSKESRAKVAQIAVICSASPWVIAYGFV